MGEKAPQPTAVLITRLQRLARSIDRLLTEDWAGTGNAPTWKARANLCRQAAARLEALTPVPGDPEAVGQGEFD